MGFGYLLILRYLNLWILRQEYTDINFLNVLNK